MSSASGHAPASGPPMPRNPRQADLRWPASEVSAARGRLCLAGFTADEASDVLDWMAVVKRVRRLGQFMAHIDADELATWRYVLPDIAWQLRHANQPTRASKHPLSA